MDINLTLKDRLNLYNQYTILQKLSQIQGDEYVARDYGLKAEIVLKGYIYDYCLLTDGFSDDFLTEDAKLVWDTLDMYSAIHSSYKKLKNPKLKREQIKFYGFDGNYEIRSMVYCRFIIKDLGRFAELSENGHDDYNSHCRLCNRYTVMVEKWKAMDKSYDLSEEQIEELIKT